MDMPWEMEYSPKVNPAGDATDYSGGLDLDQMRRETERRKNTLVTRPDKDHPALGEQAEVHRQGEAASKSVEDTGPKPWEQQYSAPAEQQSPVNSTPTFTPEGVDKGIGDTGNGKVVPAGVTYSRTPLRKAYANARPGPMNEIPPVPTDPLAVPGHFITHGVLEPAGKLLGEITAPLAMARDYVFGLSQGQPGRAMTPREVTENVFGPEAIQEHPYITKGFEILGDLSIPVPPVGRSGKAIPRTLPAPQDSLGPASFTPEGHPSLSVPGYQARDTGNIIETPIKREQSMGELIMGSQYRVPESTVPSGMAPHNTTGGVESVDGVTGPITPGFLKTAEQKASGMGRGFQDTAEQKLNAQGPTSVLRSQKYFQPPTPEGTSEAVQPLTEALQKISKEGRGRAVEQPHMSLQQQPIQAGPSSEPIPSIPGTPTYTQKEVSTVARTLNHTFDVLRKAGPYSARVADLLQYKANYAEQGTRQNYLDYLNVARGIFPVAKGRTVELEALKSGDWDTVLNSNTQTLTGLTKDQIDALVELHEIGGDVSKASEKAQATLPLNDPKVQELYQKGWNILTGRASAEPSIQQNATVFDPITGKQYSVGSPTPFWPHIPTDQQAKVKLSDEYLRKLYNRGEYDMPFETFKQKFTDWFHSGDLDVRQRKYAGIEYKRFFNALEEAKSHNTTVAEQYRRMGYETDPFRVLLRYNMGALNRSVSLGYKSEMTELMTQLLAEYGPNSTTYQYISSALQRSEGLSAREDMLQSLGWTSNAMSAAYPSFLKFSWFSNILLQPNYLVMQTSLRDTMSSVFRMYGSKLGIPKDQIDQVVARSGADFPAFLARLNRPDNGYQQYTKTALELDMFALSDRATRSPLSGIAGYLHTERVAKQFWENPTSPKALGLLKELNINPKELYDGMAQTNGQVIPEQFLARGAQSVANRAMGRTGIQGMPLWATSDDKGSRLLLMLHRQFLSNEGAMRRLLFDAPTMDVALRRGLQLVGLGTASGMAYESLKNTLAGRDWYDPGKSFTQTMEKLGIRGQERERFAGMFVKSFLDSAGTLTTGMLMAGLGMLSGQPGTSTTMLTPPVASLVEDTVQKVQQGKPLEAVVRASPLPVPGAVFKQKKPSGGMGMSLPGMQLEK